MPCKAHVCSNAVVWSLKHDGDDQIQKGARPSIVALTISSWGLGSMVDALLLKKVVSLDRTHDEESVRA